MAMSHSRRFGGMYVLLKSTSICCPLTAYTIFRHLFDSATSWSSPQTYTQLQNRVRGRLGWSWAQSERLDRSARPRSSYACWCSAHQSVGRFDTQFSKCHGKLRNGNSTVKPSCDVVLTTSLFFMSGHHTPIWLYGQTVNNLADPHHTRRRRTHGGVHQ